MILVKENTAKRRKVLKDNDRYIKIWEDVSPEWVYNHVQLLRQLCPSIVDTYGSNWIAFNEVAGTVVNTLPHTDKLIQDIYKFCLENIQQTLPYVHGDWVLSNIIMTSDNTFQMIDWDNVGIYPEKEYMEKLHKDLHSAFGDRFYDAAGI